MNRFVVEPSQHQLGRQAMRTPDDVQVMLQLHQLGWGVKRIAVELGVSKKYVRASGWVAYAGGGRRKALDAHRQWLEQQYRQHGGNAEVVRQELSCEQGVRVSIRTVERAVVSYRRQLRAEGEATVRFETPPGKQLQCDFGEMRVLIGGEPTKVHLFVGTLGYSRRPYVEPFEHERVSNWLIGLENSFRYFDGATEEVLIDNARALVSMHNVASREVVFSHAFHAFARCWGFRPLACAPFRARTKGKDERGAGYVKGNAIAGRVFESWEALRAHLAWWMREIADQRIHGTTGEMISVNYFSRRRQLEFPSWGGVRRYHPPRENASTAILEGVFELLSPPLCGIRLLKRSGLENGPHIAPPRLAPRLAA